MTMITIGGASFELGSLLIGALVPTALFCFIKGISVLFKRKIKLTGLKSQIEEAHEHLKAVNTNLSNLYQIFNVIEKRQEEILK